MQKAFYLENVLKNETIRQIVKIRAIKEKRSLKEAVKQIVAERKEKDAKKRNKLKKKKEREIEDLAAQDAEENDGLYSRTTFQTSTPDYTQLRQFWVQKRLLNPFRALPGPCAM